MLTVIALGSNMGQSATTLKDAVTAINAIEGVSVIKASSLYRTPPVGYLDQDDFINAVIMVESQPDPVALYERLAAIELEFGRVRLFKDGPRTLDLDIICAGDLISSDVRVILPHPRAQQRAFVLVPLNEIAPDLVFPDSGLTAAQALERLNPEDLSGIERIADAPSLL